MFEILPQADDDNIWSVIMITQNCAIVDYNYTAN